MTTNDYVSFETAKLLKELECNIRSEFFYTKDGKFQRNFSDEYDMYPEEYIGDGIYAPSLYSAQKWLREEHKMHILIYIGNDEHNYELFSLIGEFDSLECPDHFSTYEEALDKAIFLACELIIENKK